MKKKGTINHKKKKKTTTTVRHTSYTSTVSYQRRISRSVNHKKNNIEYQIAISLFEFPQKI